MDRNIFSINSISKYSSLFQIIGVIGLIASLIFVGLELRQSHKIALAEQQQQRMDTFINIINKDKPIHSHSQKPELKNSIMNTANEVNPIIRTDDIISPLILSNTKVFKSVLLKPYFSSIINVE